MNTFFPDPNKDTKPENRSPWSIFWPKPGYVWKYHQLMENHTPSKAFKVINQLGKIFSLVQMLPESVKGCLKMPGKTWRVEDNKVVLITNSKLYKIKGISKKNERKQARGRKCVFWSQETSYTWISWSMLDVRNFWLARNWQCRSKNYKSKGKENQQRQETLKRLLWSGQHVYKSRKRKRSKVN